MISFKPISLNKDGRLIRADYVLANPRLPARSNMISLIRTPRLLFISSDATVLLSLLRAFMLTAITRLRLVSGGQRPTMLMLRRGVFGDAQVKLRFEVGSPV